MDSMSHRMCQLWQATLTLGIMKYHAQHLSACIDRPSENSNILDIQNFNHCLRLNVAAFIFFIHGFWYCQICQMSHQRLWAGASPLGSVSLDHGEVIPSPSLCYKHFHRRDGMVGWYLPMILNNRDSMSMRDVCTKYEVWFYGTQSINWAMASISTCYIGTLQLICIGIKR